MYKSPACLCVRAHGSDYVCHDPREAYETTRGMVGARFLARSPARMVAYNCANPAANIESANGPPGRTAVVPSVPFRLFRDLTVDHWRVESIRG